MLDKQVKKLLNDQITNEYASAYLYLDFANFFYQKGLDGFGHWYDLQAREEVEHADLIRRYLIENGEEAKLKDIKGPAGQYKDAAEVLKLALEHERLITSWINEIYETAVEKKDYRTQEFCHWFIKEQMEEEVNAVTLIEKYATFAKDCAGLYALNQELAKRGAEA